MAIDLGSTEIDINPPASDDGAVRAEQNRLIREIRDLADKSRIPWTDDAQLLNEIQLRGDRLKKISPAPRSLVKRGRDGFYSRALRQRGATRVAST